MTNWEHRRVLVTVRTYPTPAKQGVEVSCTAGITDDNRWIRLYPIPYRFMEPDQRFRKYQWIELNVRKASSDPRIESYKPDLGSIQIVGRAGRDDGWQARRDIVFPMKAHCMCCIERERSTKLFPTLGFFKPREIERLSIVRDRANWTEQELGRLRQFSLWEHAPIKELEKLPFRFSYRYRCDESTCNGHNQTCIDWELGQSYRNWVKEYGDDGWEKAFRQTYESDMIGLNDTHFYVGNQRAYQNSWLIVGLWYPRSDPQARLWN
jgi:hypothetical protein